MEIMNIISFTVAIGVVILYIGVYVILYMHKREKRKEEDEKEFYKKYTKILLERAEKYGDPEDIFH